MSTTVVAVDVGWSTITSAAADHTNKPALIFPNQQQWLPSLVYVNQAGEIMPPDCVNSAPVAAIPEITRLLGQPAQIIAGAPRNGETVLATAIGPMVGEAERHFKSPVGLVVGTHPAAWPPGVVAAFRRALGRVASDAIAIPWPDAIAAQTPQPDVDCPVTNLDFGARTASVTIVGFKRGKVGKPLYSIADPAGGFVGAAKAVVTAIAEASAIDISTQSESWWTDAIDAVSTARREHPDPSGDVVIALPNPVGTVEVAARDVHDVMTSHLQQVIERLVRRRPVTDRWTIAGDPAAARPIVELSGGFANDMAVQAAVRNTIGPCTVIDSPAHAAAWGAVLLASHASTRKGLDSQHG